MFNKLFRNLLGKSTKEAPAAKVATPAPAPSAPTPKQAEPAVQPAVPAPLPSAKNSKADKKKPNVPVADLKPAADKPVSTEPKPISAADIRNATLNNASRIPAGRTPDELCEITPDMDKPAIEARLAMLYRRHNRAASSFDEAMREEAETMLEAIAAVRDKYLKPR